MLTQYTISKEKSNKAKIPSIIYEIVCKEYDIKINCGANFTK